MNKKQNKRMNRLIYKYDKSIEKMNNGLALRSELTSLNNSLKSLYHNSKKPFANQEYYQLKIKLLINTIRRSINNHNER